ncbi:MAG: hemolysin family protein [Treponema sp.]|nr:hemolysin family protein [Treponema sp.]
MNDSQSSYIALVISLFVLLCLSTFFSSCEMSYSALNRIKLKHMAIKSKRARLVLKMLETYDKLLSTVLIGNNIVNITASALAAALFISLLGPKGVSIATVIMTILVLVIGDISPKALAKETPELTALRNAPLLRFFIFVLTPINVLMSGWKRVLMKVFPSKTDRSTTEDELLTFVEEVRQEGAINIGEEQMIRQVIDFDDMKAYDIFTPRIDVAAVSVSASIEEIDRIFVKTGFSRLPVFNDRIDNITGIILLKDFYQKVMKGLKTTAQIIKPVVFITKTIKISKLLKTLQEKKAYMAVVVDEHGGTMGIVTIEDIVEELVGEIWDEHDSVVVPVKKTGDGGFIVLGNVNFIDMLNAITGYLNEDDALNVCTDESFDRERDRNSFAFDSPPDTTVANWIVESLGRLPQSNEILVWNHLTIEVLKVIKQRVLEVKVTLASIKENENNVSGGKVL